MSLVSTLAAILSAAVAWRALSEQVAQDQRHQADQVIVLVNESVLGAPNESEALGEPRVANYSRLPVALAHFSVSYELSADDESVAKYEAFYQLGQIDSCEQIGLRPILRHAAGRLGGAAVLREADTVSGLEMLRFFDAAGREWFRDGFGEPFQAGRQLWSEGFPPGWSSHSATVPALERKPIPGCVAG